MNFILEICVHMNDKMVDQRFFGPFDDELTAIKFGEDFIQSFEVDDPDYILSWSMHKLIKP